MKKNKDFNEPFLVKFQRFIGAIDSLFEYRSDYSEDDSIRATRILDDTIQYIKNKKKYGTSTELGVKVRSLQIYIKALHKTCREFGLMDSDEFKNRLEQNVTASYEREEADIIEVDLNKKQHKNKGSKFKDMSERDWDKLLS